MCSRKRTAALLLATLLAGAAVAAPDFDGERAMEFLVAQCDLGPRPPGSAALDRLRDLVADHADRLGLDNSSLCFDQEMPRDLGVVELCNLVILCGPDTGPALWLGAHYDTRPVSDLDPDPVLAVQPLLGANDGASGVAILLHLAEVFAAEPPPRRVALIFFDGEDSGVSGSSDGYCLGSRRLAAHWNDFGSPLAGDPPEALVVVDMVGEWDLDVPMEAYSRHVTGDWLERLYARAGALGLTAFRPETGHAVYDDHAPFIERGLRAVDLIDFDFPEWHTSGDVPAVCEAASLEQVGRLLADLAYRPID